MWQIMRHTTDKCLDFARRDEDSLCSFLLLRGEGVWTIMSQSWLFILVLSSARGSYIFKMPFHCPVTTHYLELGDPIHPTIRLLLGSCDIFLWPVLMFWPSNLMMLNGVAVDCRNMRAGSIFFFFGGKCEKAASWVQQMAANSICSWSFWDTFEKMI